MTLVNDAITELTSLLNSKLPETQVVIDGEGCSLKLHLIGHELMSLSPVKRQQKVYEFLTPYIADGRIHAVTMHFHLPDDWLSRI